MDIVDDFHSQSRDGSNKYMPQIHVLLGVVGCCWMLDVVGCCWMLLDVVGYHWMLDVIGYF